MKIDAQEFRVGNLYSQFGNTHEATWVTIKELEDAPDEQLWFKPIQLTEEWLLRFGFDEQPFTYDKDKLSICLSGSQYKNGRTYFNSWCILESQPMFVHQLQNLYFALTNQELAIVNPNP